MGLTKAIYIHGLDGPPCAVRVDGQETETTFDAGARAVCFETGDWSLLEMVA